MAEISTGSGTVVTIVYLSVAEMYHEEVFVDHVESHDLDSHDRKRGEHEQARQHDDKSVFVHLYFDCWYYWATKIRKKSYITPILRHNNKLTIILSEKK
jgi:hypothetical protein